MNDAVAAPEFPADLAWLNLRDPLRMAQLRGRVCALAFVNLGSAWCQQRLADLGHLRARHRDRLQVVVVHVPRFDAERDAKRSAHRVDLQQYDFPVAHDRDWTAWQHFGLDAWPTVLLIDGDGRVRERIVGENGIRDLDARIGTLVEALTPQALAGDPIRLRRDSDSALPLRFPAGLAVSGDLLYVADCGHHRVLECDARGRLLRQFGSGSAGFIDGPMELAALTRPHGLCLAGGALYVADTGNHAVRRIDLRSGDVSTVCGAGRPGDTMVGSLADPRSVVLDQPRAVVLSGDRLYVATAGDNRIWQLDLGQARIAPLCGSGALGLRDGVGEAAAFAEPVALACVQHTLYVCDAAGSAIRSVHLPTGRVATLVGGGPWQFGALDGARDDAQLQAPQALALDPESPVLWIADSGNDTLRQLRLGGGALSTVALPQRLHGPAALAVANGQVWIADTDAHAVLRLDSTTGALRHVPVGE
ncbi:thioredoxin-like domain-containing protein [Luteimonas sp. RC10]|uniref:thioredoxin-like domain-containing protein n=1 Tax=Luteimonas sp. RC10 TaxID=2587035 RepID=UPI001608ABB3|nr:thioredoxin-like domain-containing protein [Luteimonas sp. RC10]MBB3344036.1 DNA-binding beta-propeller fold protein YncE [Luteimonas sp. RC10]